MVGTGPTIAFYFLFLEYYTQALLTPCLLGARDCVWEQWPAVHRRCSLDTDCGPLSCHMIVVAAGAVAEAARGVLDQNQEVFRGVSVLHLSAFA